MEEVLFESEQRASREAIASYLETVAANLRAGEALTLRAGGEELTLDPPAEATFEVKAERETNGGPDELSVEFELEWNEGEESSSSGLEIE
ncbi:MAG: amphi-Trp domain-containing protein [Haloarculaceae archaeon]